MRAIKIIILFAIVHILFLVGFKHNMGYLNFDRYKGLRAEAESVEEAFPALEKHLKRAAKYSKNPVFYRELGRLYLEMAIAKHKFGEAAERDAYLDKAESSLREQIQRNPADALGYYRMGQVYMLYNYPLMTYMGKGRVYFRKALYLDPSDESHNLNALYIFLTQWQYLDEKEKSFVFERLDRMVSANESFIRQLRNRWIENFKDDALFKSILMENKSLWPRISKFF